MNHLARAIRAVETILVRLTAFAQNELSGAHFSLEIVLEIADFARDGGGSAKKGGVRAIGLIYKPLTQPHFAHLQ